MNWKWLFVPASNDLKKVEVVQLWEVRWMSRHGEYFHSTRPEMEVFTSAEAANAFATSLRNAFTLLRHTSGDSVSVEKAK
jgi:hypothetical protein